jgi:hypothetical protein
MKTRDHDAEVLKVAVELQARDHATDEAARANSAVREAAREVGVTDAQLDEAEAEVARRRAHEAAERSKRTRFLYGAAGATLALGLAVGVWKLSAPPPPSPWVERFTEHSRWALDVSPGTSAHLAFETEGGREVAAVTVDRAAPRADGTWFVNLDATGLPRVEGDSVMVIELSGTLPTARIYLEAGTDERWRSPPIAVEPTWTRHRVPLANFEHQRRSDGRWRVVSAAPPSGVTTVSVKLGHYVNAPEATGTLRVREVGAE